MPLQDIIDIIRNTLMGASFSYSDLEEILANDKWLKFEESVEAEAQRLFQTQPERNKRNIYQDERTIDEIRSSCRVGKYGEIPVLLIEYAKDFSGLFSPSTKPYHDIKVNGTDIHIEVKNWKQSNIISELQKFRKSGTEYNTSEIIAIFTHKDNTMWLDRVELV